MIIIFPLNQNISECQVLFEMHLPKHSLSDTCKKMHLFNIHKTKAAVHQANWSTEKDCHVNEVCSGATEGRVYQIYSAAAL